MRAQSIEIQDMEAVPYAAPQKAASRTSILKFGSGGRGQIRTASDYEEWALQMVERSRNSFRMEFRPSHKHAPPVPTAPNLPRGKVTFGATNVTRDRATLTSTSSRDFGIGQKSEFTSYLDTSDDDDGDARHSPILGDVKQSAGADGTRRINFEPTGPLQRVPPAIRPQARHGFL